MHYFNITKYILMENETGLHFQRETLQLMNLKH